MEAEPRRDRWELSAIESLVLLNGPMTSEVAAARMAIVELVVRRALVLSRIDRKFLLIFTRHTDRLSPGPAFGQTFPEPLQEVLARYRGLTGRQQPRGETSVAVQDLARSIFGSARRRTLIGRLLQRNPPERNGFMESVMMPHLAKRGFFRWSQVSRGGIFRTHDWEITPAGMVELELLRTIMADGRESFPRWTKEEPQRAAEFVDRAGPALLLIPGIAPFIRELNANTSARDVPPIPAPDSPADPGIPVAHAAPLGAFSLVALAGIFGPGEFDGFDSAFYTISEDVSGVWEAMMEAGAGLGG